MHSRYAPGPDDARNGARTRYSRSQIQILYSVLYDIRCASNEMNPRQDKKAAQYNIPIFHPRPHSHSLGGFLKMTHSGMKCLS